MENDHMLQSKTSSRTRIPTAGLKEMNPASTNALSRLVQPGTIADAVTSKTSGLSQTGRPRSTTQSGTTSRSRIASSTVKTHGRANTYSANTLGRSASTVSRTKSTVSSTTAPMARPHTSMSRSHTVSNTRRPMANAIPRAATAMGSREKEEVEGTILGKRGEWDLDVREKRMYDLVRSMEERVSQQGQSNTTLKDAVDLYKSRVTELETSSKELTEMNVTLRIQIGSLENQLSGSEKALKDAQRDHDIMIEDFNARRRMELETVRLEGRREMETMHSRHQQEIQELRKRFENELEGERAARVRELSQVTSQSALDTQRSHAELDKKEREIVTLQHDIHALKADLERERKANRDLRHNLDAASTNTVTMESSVRALKARIEFLESGREEQSQAFERLNQQMMDALAETNATKEKLRKEETLRRKLHNQVQELKGNIRVFCRVRPSLPSDPVTQVAQIQFPDEAEDCKEIAVLGPEEKSSLGAISRKNSNFSFDRVFGPSTQNAEVFDEISQLVQSALDGYNVCIFCYGQTGSGKTYTMSSLDGMIPRAVHQIYETATGLEEKGWRYTMEGNFVEVYNENLNDLLGNPDDLDKKKLEIRHDMQRGKTIITDVTTVRLDSPEMVETILKRAASNRSVAATKANERSSRSHSVFILKLIGENDITGERSEGTLNLVDLAGSERLSHSGATGERLRETQNINRSLSCLGDVIAALGQGKEGGHIPYRNSKLTYLLQFSLGGNSKTLMFVMVSPLQAHLAETLTSLKFATKVHNTHIGTAKRQARVREC
ncbi:putative kinesin family protein (KlpA) [Aspergillus saccharolyticus JOP 1030-1]|uniref:Kinesin-like protein n=1 Tax=Aspergillus saccharolyticus JOP 1030-1 TaxID=1450539 RepID=A0A318ZNE1_9EURO|nr:kinesin motor domain protein [Aspergillus saccharolyticus JOP 1030-1]PYH49131.1 kinesin motor domain protein [Aspergillus saccharolyticus JOP 1030-1]